MDEWEVHRMNEICCNGCGRRLEGRQKEDALSVTKEWGYFSEKDLERHRFVLCEACYDRMISGFVIPVVIEEQTEV